MACHNLWKSRGLLPRNFTPSKIASAGFLNQPEKGTWKPWFGLKMCHSCFMGNSPTCQHLTSSFLNVWTLNLGYVLHVPCKWQHNEAVILMHASQMWTMNDWNPNTARQCIVWWERKILHSPQTTLNWTLTVSYGHMRTSPYVFFQNLHTYITSAEMLLQSMCQLSILRRLCHMGWVKWKLSQKI